MHPTNTHSPRILVTDDNPVNLTLICKTLGNRYPNVLQTSDGKSCLEYLNQHAVDLLLLDMNMPEMNGLEVLQAIPSLPGNRQPRVMVVSADHSPETVARAFKQGAADYLTTPFSNEEMLARVQTQLSLRRRSQYLEELVSSRTRELQEANEQIKQTHKQLMQAEKMASLGQLAAGIAHEINNPSAFISSNLQTLNDYFADLDTGLATLMKLAANPNDPDIVTTARALIEKSNFPYLIADAKALLSESLTGVGRVKMIVDDLKTFSHPEQENWQATDLNGVINSALNIAASEIKYKAEVDKQLMRLPEVQCIAPQISQVLVNLLVNAAQAIPEFGIIWVTSRTAGPHHVEIIVSDNGSGIATEIIDRIYDPFFTTKPVGDGTGLGLSVSYGIIQNHQGTIVCTEREGGGTQFTITLPITRAPSSLEDLV